MFGGPWDSTLIMMCVPSLKMGVPSFYIRVEFWKVVHPSVKGFKQARSRKTSSHFGISTICIDLKIDRNFGSFFQDWFLR